MKSLLLTILLFATCSMWGQASAKTTADGCAALGSRSGQALQVLGQALNAAGGLGLLQQIRDFEATGRITYYWGGKQVSGKAVLRARGTDQFRLDASLPKGMRSWSISHGTGIFKDMDGAKSAIPYHNAIDMGALSFPALRLLTALANATTTISDGNAVQVGGQSFYRLCVEPRLADARLSQLASAKYFVDPHTFEIVGLQDNTHPKETFMRSIPHAVYYSDFRVVNGISVPFSVVETMYAGRVWSLQLDGINFNAGLTDADFRF